MSVNKRVEELIDKVAQNKAAFASATNISPVSISHICSGRNKVSLTIITQIMKAYPSVSLDWLVMGQGDMFKNQEQLHHKIVNDLSLVKDDVDKLSSTLKSRIDQIITKATI